MIEPDEIRAVLQGWLSEIIDEIAIVGTELIQANANVMTRTEMPPLGSARNNGTRS
jgi:hypothetical protein